MEKTAEYEQKRVLQPAVDGLQSPDAGM